MEKQETILRTIGGAAAAHGLTCYAVGGYVRDTLMERPTKDIDIVVLQSGGGIALAQILHKEYRFGRPVLFPRFQTAQTRYQGIEVELVAARSEEYDPSSRKPTVKKARLADDIARRDFTVNALVMSLSERSFGRIIDHTGQAREDLKQGVIRCIGKPAERFREDPLRMLRAVRFACQLGFSVDGAALRALRRMKKRLTIVSAERITAELEKIILSPDPAGGMRQLAATGLLDIIDPELAGMRGFAQDSVYHHEDLLEHTLSVVARTRKTLPVRLAALYHDAGKQYAKQEKDGRFVYYFHERYSTDIARRSLKRLRFPNKVINEVCSLIGNHMINYGPEWGDAAVRRLIHKAGPRLRDLLNLRAADMLSLAPPYNDRTQVRELERRIKALNVPRVRKIRSPLNGYQIQQLLNLGPGKKIAQIKERLVDGVLTGELTGSARQARRFVLKHFGQEHDNTDR